MSKATPDKVQRTNPNPNVSKKWHQILTIDILLRVLSRSIFHPAIVLIFYLCIAAMHKHRTPTAYYTLYWASFLLLVGLVRILDQRITYGRKRKVEWEDEVVIVTGGGKGLGRVLVEMLIRRGASVGVLELEDEDREVREMGEQGPGDLCWVKCDVSDANAVKKVVEKIEKEFGRRVSVVVNNAAAGIHGKGLLSGGLKVEEVRKTMDVNVMGMVNVVTATMESLKQSAKAGKGATVVTIGSVLGCLAPKGLADYAASKAAVVAVHESLRFEIAMEGDADVRRKLKMVLVETGQMETGLFEDMTQLPWYANFFGPILDAKDVAAEVVKVVERGEGGVIRMPAYAAVVGSGWWAVLPGSVKRVARWWSGIDRAMGGMEKEQGL